MKIAVCVKHALDETELKVDQSGRPLVEASPSKMSTFDKNAVEEAVRIRSAHGGEVTVFSVGSADAKRTIKEALAMGADRAVLVTADVVAMDSLGTARVLAAALKKAGGPDVVLCSEGSSDTYTGQVPPMLAELLSLPYVGYARKIGLDGAKAILEQSLEDVVRVVECGLPFVASVVSEINEPRYPTLIQIMQASKKPLEEATPEGLGLGGKVGGGVTVQSMNGKPMIRKQVVIEGSPDEAAAKLIEALTKEGVISK